MGTFELQLRVGLTPHSPPGVTSACGGHVGWAGQPTPIPTSGHCQRPSPHVQSTDVNVPGPLQLGTWTDPAHDWPATLQLAADPTTAGSGQVSPGPSLPASPGPIF